MFALIFSALCAWVAFFLPAFHTYKILSTIPNPDEQELKRVAMYWSVIGCFVGVEYVAEWFVSWLPFYWELKTIFLFFLALPQVQGSTFVYTTYLQPFFAQNESQIDQGIVSVQAGAIDFVKSKLLMIWELLWSVINKTPAPGQTPSTGSTQTAPAPTLQSVIGLVQSYAPAIVNALQPAAPKNPPAAAAAAAPSSGYSTSVSTPSVSTPMSDAPSFPEPQHT